MWDALAGAGASLLGGAATGLINSVIGRNNAKWSAALDWKYLKKAKELDYQYDANQYFDLDKLYYQYQQQQQYEWSRRYAENSSKWQVQGLRNANLNPILAATDGNFRGTFGEPVSMGSHGGHGGGSSGSIRSHNVDGSISDLGQSIMQGAKSGAEVSNIEQNTQNQATQSALNLANTAKTKIEAANAAENGGYHSFASQLFNSAKNTLFGVGGTKDVSLSGLLDTTAKNHDSYLKSTHDIKPRSDVKSYSPGDNGRASKTFKDITGYGEPRKIVPRKGNVFFQK